MSPLYRSMLLACALIFSPATFAAQTMTFAQWIAACSLLSDPMVQTVDAGTCLGYTQGVLDTARLTEPEQEQLFCDPRASLTARDYVKLGQRWAAEQASGIETSAAFQLMQAFKFYMPCDQPTPSADSAGAD